MKSCIPAKIIKWQHGPCYAIQSLSLCLTTVNTNRPRNRRIAYPNIQNYHDEGPGTYNGQRRLILLLRLRPDADGLFRLLRQLQPLLLRPFGRRHRRVLRQGVRPHSRARRPRPLLRLRRR